MSIVTLQFIDYSGEKSAVSWNAADPSGASFDWAAFVATQDGIADAIEAVTDCTRGPLTISVQAQAGSVTLPASEDAQREAGLRVFYHDTTNNRKGTLTIPGPDKSLMAVQGYDLVDWAGTEMAALETALEADVLSRDGNAIEIDKGVLVGRHN